MGTLIPATNTPTSLPTNTPTITPSPTLPACAAQANFIHYSTAVTRTGSPYILLYSTNISCSFADGVTTDGTLFCTLLFDGRDNDASIASDQHNSVTLRAGANNSVVYWKLDIYTETPGTAHALTLPSNTVTTLSSATHYEGYTTLGNIGVSTTFNYRQQTTAAYVGTLATMVKWSFQECPFPVATATPVPTSTAVPCQSGNPDEGTVNGGGTEFSPPKLIPGACFTIVPELTMDVPSIVDWTVSEVPATIGIPGVQLCTQYWDTKLKVFNFDILAGISWVISLVCVAIIYRMFQN
jgi:hypothetical protein